MSILAAIFLAGLSSFSFAETLAQIAVGHGGSYVVKSDGTLWAWGDYNVGKTYGTPADEKKNTHTVPLEIENLSDVVAISAGDGHSIALKKDARSGSGVTMGRANLATEQWPIAIFRRPCK